MRIRTIKPEFWRSDDMAAHSVETRLVFIGLWNYADDYGIGRDHERLIATDLFPLEDYEVGAKRVAEGMAALAEAGQILRYTGDDGNAYFYVVSWNTHQTISRKSRSRQPFPTSEDFLSAGKTHADYMSALADDTKEEGTGNREQGEGKPVARSGKAPKSRAHPLPDDWKPNDKAREKCVAGNYDCDREAEAMRTWAEANGVTRVNWDSQFNNWLLKARPQKAGTVTSGNAGGRVWQE
ncbi:hypothetical protein GS966_11135 [Rhodococcus hoagii]|nr:hypothetical protein [Prescottella equi]